MKADSVESLGSATSNTQKDISLQGPKLQVHIGNFVSGLAEPKCPKNSVLQFHGMVRIVGKGDVTIALFIIANSNIYKETAEEVVKPDSDIPGAGNTTVRCVDNYADIAVLEPDIVPPVQVKVEGILHMLVSDVGTEDSSEGTTQIPESAKNDHACGAFCNTTCSASDFSIHGKVRNHSDKSINNVNADMVVEDPVTPYGARAHLLTNSFAMLEVILDSKMKIIMAYVTVTTEGVTVQLVATHFHKEFEKTFSLNDHGALTPPDHGMKVSIFDSTPRHGILAIVQAMEFPQEAVIRI